MKSYSETKHMTRSQLLGFLWGLFCSSCLGMNFADCCTDELNFFEFSRTAKIFNAKFTNRLKKCQRLLSTFAIAFVIFLIISAFIDVYHYLWTFNTSLRQRSRNFGLWSHQDRKFAAGSTPSPKYMSRDRITVTTFFWSWTVALTRYIENTRLCLSHTSV